MTELPHVESPPIAPLSPTQLRFLALHAHYLVTTWQWHFVATQLRATAGRQRATIWRDELDDLVARGLMQYGVGCADVRVTDLGREACKTEVRA